MNKSEAIKLTIPQEIDNDFTRRAYGCIMGAFIGDSIGSYLEFKKDIPEHLLNVAMKMPGGGPFQVAPGQVTDDSELALMLGYALAEGEGKLDVDLIAKYYAYWFNSFPFDIGKYIYKKCYHLQRVDLYKNEKFLRHHYEKCYE
jgi:ADP-ribosylglycohydrolase